MTKTDMAPTHLDALLARYYKRVTLWNRAGFTFLFWGFGRLFYLYYQVFSEQLADKLPPSYWVWLTLEFCWPLLPLLLCWHVYVESCENIVRYVARPQQ